MVYMVYMVYMVVLYDAFMTTQKQLCDAFVL